MSTLRRLRLGKADLFVSELALGTVTFGDVTVEPAADAILSRYLEAGGNFIDTADVYADGRSEEILGRLLRHRRHEVVVGTKGGMTGYSDASPGGCSPERITEAVNASLRRLQTDHIDLYQLHVPDPATPIEATLRALDALVRSGKVRFIGVSNLAGWQLAKVLGTCSALSLPQISALQAQYSLVVRDIEFELIPLCVEEQLPVIAWAPLAGGLLSGKYDPTRPAAAGTRLGDSPRSVHPLSAETQPIIDAVRALANSTGRTASQIALRWVMKRTQVISTIVGARSIEQLTDNLGVAGWVLEEEHDRLLTKASRRNLPYPQGLQRMLGCHPRFKP